MSVISFDISRLDAGFPDYTTLEATNIYSNTWIDYMSRNNAAALGRHENYYGNKQVWEKVIRQASRCETCVKSKYLYTSFVVKICLCLLWHIAHRMT